MSALSIRNLVKSFGGLLATDNLTFEVEEGLIVAWRDTFDWATVGTRVLLGMPRIVWRMARGRRR